MDYLDATNMLGVWKSGGRHNWNNADFDKLVADGSVDHQRPGRPEQAMQDAEKLLVTTPPASSSTTRCRPAAQAVPQGLLEGPEQDRLHRHPVARRGHADRLNNTLYYSQDVETMRKG